MVSIRSAVRIDRHTRDEKEGLAIRQSPNRYFMKMLPVSIPCHNVQQPRSRTCATVHPLLRPRFGGVLPCALEVSTQVCSEQLDVGVEARFTALRGGDIGNDTKRKQNYCELDSHLHRIHPFQS